MNNNVTNKIISNKKWFSIGPRFVLFVIILLVLVGTFSPVPASAQTTPEPEFAACVWRNPKGEAVTRQDSTKKYCTGLGPLFISWNGDSSLTTTTETLDKITPASTPSGSGQTIKDQIEKCGFGPWGDILGCFQWIIYLLFVTIPSALMGFAAIFFNFMAALTLSSYMYDQGFIQNIWYIIRDFANIFFILILLYAAFQIILGLGHGGGKKIIASVILVALLVNFSLFFTKIVIDASNVVALIFYNRIDTDNVTYVPISESTKTGVREKDMAGALVSSFNINTFFSETTISKIREGNNLANLAKQCPGCDPSQFVGNNNANKINPYLLMSLMVAYGIVVVALGYAFLIAALSFLGRMLTLIVLMIISPLAFVTSAVPKLKGVNTIGFDSWLKKLLETSFVAAIFIFVIYITSEIVKAGAFNSVADPTNTGILSTLMLIFVPAILIVLLILKGAKYAKEASGEFTGMVMTGAKAIGGLVVGGAAGLAVGAVAGGGAAALRSTVGRLGARAAGSGTLKAAEAKGGVSGFAAARLRDIGKYTGTKSFDVRATGLGQKAISKAGLTGTTTLGGEVKKGGWEQTRKDKVEKRKKRAEELEVGEDEKVKQELNKTEMDLQKLLAANAKQLAQLDKEIEKKRQSLRDATAQYGAGRPEAIKAGRDLQNSKNRKKALKDAVLYAGDIDTTTGTTTTTNAQDYRSNHAGGYTDAAGVFHTRTINYMEDYEVPERKQTVVDENRERRRNYAEKITRPRGKFWRAARFAGTLGTYNAKAEKEAAHNIIMEAKLESKKE